MWHPPEGNFTGNVQVIYPWHEFENNYFNTLRPSQNGRYFADILNSIFLNENVWIPIKFSVKFVPKGPIDNIPALCQIMVWRRPGDKPLSEPMMVRLQMHICVTRSQWVKITVTSSSFQWVNALSRLLLTSVNWTCSLQYDRYLHSY